MGFAWVLVGICKGTSIKASLLTYTQKLEKNKGKSKLFSGFSDEQLQLQITIKYAHTSPLPVTCALY